MKKGLLFMVLMLLMGAQTTVNAQELTLSDVQNSGCLNSRQARANGRAKINEDNRRPTIILTKEGTILTVQLFNYEANCGTTDFEVMPSISGGSNGTPYSVSIQVIPMGDEDMDCICPYNISFTIRNLEATDFFFSCCWFQGQVTLTENKPLVLGDINEVVMAEVNIDGLNYTLEYKTNTARLIAAKRGYDIKGELDIPSELSYDGRNFIVTGIGDEAFSECNELTAVTIPSCVTSIGECAFVECNNLANVYCHAEEVPDTHPTAFGDIPTSYWDYQLPIASATLHVPAGSIDKYKTTWPWSEFGNIVALKTTAETTIDGVNYFLYLETHEAVITTNRTCSGELNIPSEVTYEGEAFVVKSMTHSAFHNNPELTKVKIPKTIESIRHSYPADPDEDVETTLINPIYMNPFRGCTALESIEADEENPSLKSVDGVLFSQDGVGQYYYKIGSYYGTGLYCYPEGARQESYIIPENVEWIGGAAFANNQYLTVLTIPNNTKHICYNAFSGCSNLTDVYCKAENVPVAWDGAFKDVPIASATLHVPAGSIDKYKTTWPWSEFGNIVALAEEPHQPLPFLEGNPIWFFKYEPMQRAAYWANGYWDECFLDAGNQYYTYYFLGGKKEIEGKVYTMMGEVGCDRDGKITLNRRLPVREENGIVYAITDSLPGLIEFDYLEPPYLQQGKECVLYNFNTKIGESLYPQNEAFKEAFMVGSYGTYQLMDGTDCRVLKTRYDKDLDLYEKLGFLHGVMIYGVMDPPSEIVDHLGGNVSPKHLNAYYQDDVMLYKAPDAPEGLCVNDTCWTHDDAYDYAMSYKANPYHEEVMSYIRELQAAEEPVTFTQDQMATIILPTTPDASKGKYYRLDRVEDGQIVFEQELQPQARVPYIIVPSEDFSINPGSLDLEGLTKDSVSIEGVTFIGSYVRKELPALTGGDGGGSLYYDLIDKTPDCSLSPLGETGKGAIIGALRAYLLVNWSDPYNPGGTRGPNDKQEIVLKDNPNDIKTLSNSHLKGEDIYDLSGKKIVNRKSSNNKSYRGIFIEDGKKKVSR